jgi:hypothetical protein
MFPLAIMKVFVSLLPAVCLAVVSCETGGNFASTGYDPLDAAGGGNRSTTPVSDTSYRPGEFVRAAMDNTAFFKSRPDGAGSADKLLPRESAMKVISDDGSYVKVELDSGEVGFVPVIQVVGQNDTAAMPYGNDAVQVWPPVESTIPLPPADGTAPAEGSPMLPPTIDPDAPTDLPALPDDAPTPGLGPAPALPDDAPTPGLGAEPAKPDEGAKPAEETKPAEEPKEEEPKEEEPKEPAAGE